MSYVRAPPSRITNRNIMAEQGDQIEAKDWVCCPAAVKDIDRGYIGLDLILSSFGR
jgi:hypothetical protein